MPSEPAVRAAVVAEAGLLFSASAQRQKCPQCENQEKPFHIQMLHFIFLPNDPKACPGARRSVFTISSSNSVANYVP